MPRRSLIAFILAEWISGTHGASYANSTTSSQHIQNSTNLATSTTPAGSTSSSTIGSTSSLVSAETSTPSTSTGLGSYILAGINGVSSQTSSTISSSRSGSSFPASAGTASSLSLSSATAPSANVTAADISATDAASLYTSIANASSFTQSTANVSSINLTTTSQSVLQSSTLNASVVTSSVQYANIAIAPTGSGYEYASSCNSLLLAWSNSSEAARLSWTIYEAPTVSISVASELVAATLFGPATTTLCDGVPRVIGGMETLASLTTSNWTTMSWTLTDYLTTFDPYTYSVHSPDCTINMDDCSSLWSAMSVSDARVATMTNQEYANAPACNYQVIVSESVSSNACASCTISANGVQLTYWPEEIVGNPCAANHTYVTATPTRPGFPNSRVIGNMTYISPTVYLGFTFVAAPYGEAGYCGGVVDSTVIPMAPEAVSSVRFKSLDNCTSCHGGPESFTIQGVYPVNYADFNPGAVPVAAYRGMPGCVRGGCDTVTDASYSPFLSVPQQLKSMESIWSNCALFVDGVWDPPVALTPVESEAGVTTDVPQSHTSYITSVPAEPVSTLVSSVASSTAPGPAPYSSSKTPSLPGYSDPPSSTAVAEDPNSDHSTALGQPSSSATEPAESEPAANPYTTAITSNVQVIVVSSKPGQSKATNGETAQISADSFDPQAAPGTTNALSILSAAESPDQKPAATVGAGASATQFDPDTPSTASQAVVSIAGSSYTVVHIGSVASVRSQEVIFDAAPITFQGQTVSLASNGIVVGSATVAFTLVPTAPAAASKAILKIAGSTYTVLQSEFVASIGSQEVTVGAAPVTVGGQLVSLAPGGIVLGSSTIAFTTPISSHSAVVQAAVTAGGQSITAFSSDGSVVLIDSTMTATVAPGGVATLGAQIVTAASEGLIVGSATVPFSNVILAPPTVTQQAAITAGSETIAAVLKGSYVVLMDGSSATTVAVGGIATFAGQTISAGMTGLGVNGQSTVAFSSITTDPYQAVITAGGQLFTAFHSGNLVLLEAGSSTLTLVAGDPATVNGEIVSALPEGSALVFDGTSVSLNADSALMTSEPVETVVTVNSHTFTAMGSIQGGSSIVLEDQSTTVSVTPGAVTIFESQTISALSHGRGFVIDGTSTVLFTSVGPITDLASVELTISGQAFTIIETSGANIVEDASTTITLPNGDQTVLAGQTISAASAGGVMVVDGTLTETLSAATSTRSLISNIVNPSFGASSATQPVVPTSTKKSAASMTSPSAHFLAVIWSGLILVSVASAMLT